MSADIFVFDRQAQASFVEKVYGDRWVKWAHEDPLGQKITSSPFVQKCLSQMAGLWMKGPFSRSRVQPFVEDYGIRLEDFEVPEHGFESFNDFFIRKLRAGARRFPANPLELGAPAEGRLSVFPVLDRGAVLVVKGKALSLTQLLGSESLASSIERGHAFVFRLCPVDYHRFHFPDDGHAGPPLRLPGLLHSVNPLSLTLRPDVFLQNERMMTVFEGRHLGRMLLLEVGAVCVGAVVQTFDPEESIQRGQEKGYFEFGGSTVILLTGPSLRPEADLLERSQQGQETLVRLGESLGRRL